MKKTAIFLVFTLLLTMLGGMTTVWAANAPDVHDTFEVDAETGLVIYGDQLTASPTMAAAKDAYFNNTGTYRYLYFPSFSSWQWVTYDLNVAKAGSYHVTARVSTTATEGKRGVLQLSRMNFNDTAAGSGATTNIADVLLSQALIPAKGAYANAIVDLGIIDLPEGVTTIGVKNVGNITAYLHNLTLTPSEENVIIRDRDDYLEAYGRTSNLLPKDGIETHIFHKVINATNDPNPSYMIHKVYSPKKATYKLSFRYVQASVNSKINVELGTMGEDDDITYSSPIEYTFPNKVSNIQYYELGNITLEEGYNYIKTTAAYGDFYLGTMKLEETTELAEDVIKLTDTSTILLNVDSTTTGFENNDFEFVVNTDKQGTYDVTMCMYPSSASYNEHRFAFTVNGVEQSYSGIKTDFSGNWKDVTIGRVYLPEGTSTLKISTIYGYGNNLDGKNEYISVFNYMNIKLNKVAETEINTATKNDSSTVTNIFYKSTAENGVRFVSGNTLDINVNVSETGVYNLAFDSNSKTNGAVWTLAVNEAETTLETYGTEEKLEKVELGKVYLTKGDNALSLTLDNGTAVDVTSIYVSKDYNAVKLYRDSITVRNQINSLEYLRTIKSDKKFTSGKLIAQADLSSYAGKEVLLVFAVYNANNQIANINCKTLTPTASTVEKLEVTGVSLAEGYTAKVFVWDNATLFGVSEIY